jgi:hypothetical protein
MEKLVLHHFEQHAGLVVGSSATNLFRRRLAYWRKLFAAACPREQGENNWQPNKEMRALYQGGNLPEVVVTFVEDGVPPQPAEQPAPINHDLSQYLIVTQ